ncbi:hypothetical protein JAAARDRAFT_189767 [Jaapia argillacea MUCL 33604]|uniref:DNA mismatch repair proteins mutS family domain-containing protein n=1 Tax=Jaapia argillacea MUCL 33604 TaxID=933084 RepID=A0A067QIN4_9AGAM|nr:hypothetical protein JAAARDRAFT_189767 [Jaapia argillacea MUCL 33604]
MASRAISSSHRKVKLTTKSKRKRPAQDGSDIDHDEEAVTESGVAIPGMRGGNKKVRWGSEVVQSGDEGEEEDETEEGSKIEEDSSNEKICLATTCQSGRMGCAYYDPVKAIIYVLEDTQETPHFDLTRMLLEQTNPDIVLTSSRADDKFMDVLQDFMDTSQGIFQIRPYKDFVAGKGRERLLSLRLLSELPTIMAELGNTGSSDSGPSTEPMNAYDFMQRRRDYHGDPTMKRWNASIRLSNFASMECSPFCLSAVGALLNYLACERAVGELDDQGIGGLDVRGIEALALDEVMQINADTLFLEAILNNTRTTLGRALLRTWLLRPCLSIPAITARHDAISCFLSPDNLVTSDAMHNHLKGVKNVPKILSSMRMGNAGISQWGGLVNFAFHSAMLREACTELHHVSRVEVIKKLLKALDSTNFKEVGSLINGKIDWEESANAGRVCIRPHVDEELDKLKHIYHGIDSVLCKVAERVCLSVPSDYASSLNVVYFPQLGFLICVPMLDEWKANEEIKEIDGWSFQFSSESNVYFKSGEMHDLDTHIGDLHCSIVDREIELVQALLENILVYDQAIADACDVCAELDCLLSFAEASRAYDYVRPEMVKENIINIKQGRHPLQEQVVATFVPNDAILAGGRGVGSHFTEFQEDQHDCDELREAHSVLICTGANSCGKSVYLKQTALIQYMAQIGCFVPALSAKLGIADKILTRIQTRESVSRLQSAFMIDLNQVSLALRNSTARSLILLDEFGKGTLSTGSYIFFAFWGTFYRHRILLSSSCISFRLVADSPMALVAFALGSVYACLVCLDGAGLFCGVIKSLLGRGLSCPKVLAATHFHEVFTDELLAPSELPVTFAHMQVMITSSSGELLGVSRNTSVELETPTGSIHDGEEISERALVPGERITYFYRVAKGLTLQSHAAKCAEIFGIPARVVQRAQYVTDLLSTQSLGLLLDEEMTDTERQDLEDAELICRKFLAVNFEEESRTTRNCLGDVLGRHVDGDAAEQENSLS